MSAPALIELQGCVNPEGKPFVLIVFDGQKIGQLTPAEALNFGIRGIQASIESERDAAVWQCSQEIAKDDSPEERNQYAAAMLTLIREYRGQVDPDPRGDVEGP